MANALNPIWIVATSGLLLALLQHAGGSAGRPAATESNDTSATDWPGQHQLTRVRRASVGRFDLSVPVHRVARGLLKALGSRDRFVVSPMGLTIMLSILFQGALSERQDSNGASSKLIKRSLQTVFGYDHKCDLISSDHKRLLYDFNELIAEMEDSNEGTSFLNMLVLQRFAEKPEQLYDRLFEQTTEFYRAKLDSWRWGYFNSEEETWKGTLIETVNKWIDKHSLDDSNKLDADKVRDGAWEDGAMAIAGAAFEYRWIDGERFSLTSQGNLQAMSLTKARFFETAQGRPKQPQYYQCPQSDPCLSYYLKYLTHMDEFAALELPLDLAKGYDRRRRTSLILIEPAKPAGENSMKRLAEQLLTFYYNNRTNLQMVLDALDCPAANFQMSIEIPKFRQQADRASIDMEQVMTVMQMAGIFERGNYRQMLCGVTRAEKCVYLNDFRHMTMVDVGPTGINVDMDKVNFDEALPEDPLNLSAGSNLHITYPFIYFVVYGNVPLLMGQMSKE